MNRKLYEHHTYIREHFEDMPEVALWRWTEGLQRIARSVAARQGPAPRALFTDG